MNSAVSILLALPLVLAGQVISSIPESAIRLNPFYLSSQQNDVRAKLSAPAAIAVARSGNIYIFDDGNSRIVKLDARGRFISEFGQPGSGAGAVDRADLNDSIAVDQNENVYVSDPISPKVEVFSSNGTFLRSFRVPFPMTGIAVNRKHEVLLAIDTARPTQLIYVFSETGKFLRRFGERLVRRPGSLARAVNLAVIACDAQDNLFVAFRSWPLIRKYSPDGTLITENQFTVPSELISDAQRNNYSLDFFATHADSSFVPPLITHSISVNGTGPGYLLLNAHSVVVFALNGQVLRQFHFRAPRDRNNVFLRLVGSFNSRTVYFLDTRSAEIYNAQKL
jgi:hypothetical protein